RESCLPKINRSDARSAAALERLEDDDETGAGQLIRANGASAERSALRRLLDERHRRVETRERVGFQIAHADFIRSQHQRRHRHGVGRNRRRRGRGLRGERRRRRAKLAHDENRDHERRGKEQRGRQPFASEAEPGPGGLNHDKCSSCCFRKDWTVGPRSTLRKVATWYSWLIWTPCR